MAEYSGFFNGEQQYGQEELARYFDNIYESGISMLNDTEMTFLVEATATGVNVAWGFSLIKGFYLYSDTTKSVNITKDGNYDRIDRIVLKLDLGTKKITIEHKKGTAATNPSAPILQRDNVIYELSLAQVKVGKSGGYYVVDERADKDLCGAIRPKNMTEFNLLIDSFQLRFDTWLNAQEAKGWRNIYIQSTQPVGAVEGSIWMQELT